MMSSHCDCFVDDLVDVVVVVDCGGNCVAIDVDFCFLLYQLEHLNLELVNVFAIADQLFVWSMSQLMAKCV